MAKQITANFPGKCSKCGGAIARGANIMWEKGAGSWHVKCPAVPAPVSPRKAAPATDAAPFEVYEKWEPCKAVNLRDASGESRRYAKATSVRVRAGAPEGTVAEAGVYVIVGQTGRYQTADEADDMGDCDGAGWSMTLFLRRATAEENAKDEQERFVAALPGLFQAIADFAKRSEAARTKREFYASVEGQENTGAWNWKAIKAAGILAESDGELVATWPLDSRYNAKATRYATTDGRAITILDTSTYDYDYTTMLAPRDLAEKVWDAMLAERPISVEDARKRLDAYKGKTFGDELYAYVVARAEAA
jgi:hypothetical protein